MWNRRIICLLGGLLVLRIAFIMLAPLDLSPDEAYYWDWSRRLAWGYYSKPPMVAWIIALFTSIFGNSAFGVRLPAATLSTLAIIPVYLLGRRLFGARAGFLAALAAVFMPGACVLGFAMTIDPPLIFFWSWAMYSTWLALEESGRKSAVFWIISGILAGLGMLSKQTMMAFWPLVFIFLMAEPGYRKRLLSPWPYIAALISLAPLGPVLWWNDRHGWIMLEHTAHHFEPGATSYLTFLKTAPDFIISQLGIISPITWMLSVAIGLDLIWRLFKKDGLKRKDGLKNPYPHAIYLTALSIAPVALIMLLSLRQRVNGNWPAPFYLASSVMLGGWASMALDANPVVNRMRGLFKPGLILGAAMSVFVYAIPWTITLTGLNGGHLDITARLKGWKDLGVKVGEINGKIPTANFLIGTKRQIVSELAFYAPGQPRVYRWAGDKGEIKSQYELWPGPCGKIGKDAMVVTYKDEGLPEDLKAHFKEVSLFAGVKIPVGRSGANDFNLYIAKGLASWPGCGPIK